MGSILGCKIRPSRRPVLWVGREEGYLIGASSGLHPVDRMKPGSCTPRWPALLVVLACEPAYSAGVSREYSSKNFPAAPCLRSLAHMQQSQYHPSPYLYGQIHVDCTKYWGMLLCLVFSLAGQAPAWVEWQNPEAEHHALHIRSMEAQLPDSFVDIIKDALARFSEQYFLHDFRFRSQVLLRAFLCHY